MEMYSQLKSVEARLLAPTDRYLAQKVRSILDKSDLCLGQQVGILWIACTGGKSKVWGNVGPIDFKRFRQLVDVQEVLQWKRKNSICKD
jgi:hypothetical protein